MTDLIAELAEVVRLIRKDNAGAGQWGMPSAAVNYLRTHHAELTRILTDDAAIRAAHHDLVIRLGEVTTELEAARKDAERYAALYEILIRGNLIVGEARLSLHVIGVPPSREDMARAIDAAMKESGK